MRECFTYRSVRGAAGNGGPYRDPRGSAYFHFNGGKGTHLLKKSMAS